MVAITRTQCDKSRCEQQIIDHDKASRFLTAMFLVHKAIK